MYEDAVENMSGMLLGLHIIIVGPALLKFRLLDTMKLGPADLGTSCGCDGVRTQLRLGAENEL